MNTAELAERIAAEHDLGKGQARKVVEAVLATIVQAAVSGEDVALGGFGRFKVADRPARQGRNPATGEAMEIAASRKLAFTPAKPVREALNAAPAVNGTKARPGTGSATQSARTQTSRALDGFWSGETGTGTVGLWRAGARWGR